MKSRSINLHVSVDCVVMGYDGEDLKVLLVRQLDKNRQEGMASMKLPGSLIYEDENLDEAAQRVLFELTGLENMDMIQFHTFGSKDRTSNPKDVNWLQRFHHLESGIDRIVTVGYLTMIKIEKKYTHLSDEYEACWVKLQDVGELAFDHNLILDYAMKFIRHYVNINPSVLFDLLPKKFVISEVWKLYELVYGRSFDIRNFHKKISMMEFIIALDERQVGVAHRAARYYKFDRKIYNKLYGTNKSFKI